MNENVELKITVPKAICDVLGIDEETAFETYFEDGCIKIRLLDEEDAFKTEETKECILCPKCRRLCGACRK